MSSDTYEIYAVRYAHHHRMARDNFYGGDPHDGPMPLDYFVWAVVGESRTLIFDTGFDEAMARKRGREFLLPPRDDIHRVRTTSAETSVSIHLLTNDTGCVWRHAFDPESGKAKPFRSGYVNVSCHEEEE